MVTFTPSKLMKWLEKDPGYIITKEMAIEILQLVDEKSEYWYGDDLFTVSGLMDCVDIVMYKHGM